jgi:aerobic-type carbon monoxide dehydrogenase small subunit (CoxS/CutS family)
MEIVVNETRHQVDAVPERTLLTVLRDELELTGTKYGCGEGQCGACTVLIDGSPARSCQIRVSAMGGRKITTIEGLAQHDALTHEPILHPVQQAFLDVEAMQCGYCTAGMIMSGVALLNKNANPDDAAIVQAMQGNVCRCGTYPRIVTAVRLAAKSMPRGVVA